MREKKVLRVFCIVLIAFLLSGCYFSCGTGDQHGRQAEPARFPSLDEMVDRNPKMCIGGFIIILLFGLALAGACRGYTGMIH